MTEEEAQDKVRELVGAEGCQRLQTLVSLIETENSRQNLVAQSTLSSIWTRHVLDSIQLLRFASGRDGLWIDIGTGGGFPGLAIAAARPSQPVMLVEPRRLRADFLVFASRALNLSKVEVRQQTIERVSAHAEVISARAVASTEKLLQAARQCSTPGTRWLLLRGTLGHEERSVLEAHPTMMFHVEQSWSDPASVILVGGPRQ